MRDLDALYKARFNDRERVSKERIWQVLVRDFFQQFVPSGGTVLDLACGFGEFSRNIAAARKIAVDANPESASFVAKDVEFHHCSADDLSMLEEGSVDVCFTSNFFEHLPDKAAMDAVLQEALRVLKPGGRFVAMQPNIKYAGDEYWDFYDHLLPLSHLSASEGFKKNGYQVERLIGRFIPFSTKSRYPQHPAIVRLYLKLRFLWPILGKQFVIVARKPLPAGMRD